MLRAFDSIMRRTSKLLLSLLVSCCILFFAACLQAQQVREYHVKAVFLYNLIHFVNWPDSKNFTPHNFVIGIYGPDPFNGAIDKVITGEKKYNKPIKIIRYTNLSDIDPNECRILFIHRDMLFHWPAIQKQLGKTTILTVADKPGFPEQGGMVNLLKKGQRIKVEINYKAVQKSGLSMSAKLLSLARIVQ